MPDRPKPTVLLRSRHAAAFPDPSRERLYVDRPDPEVLERVEDAQLWAPRDDRFARLPEIIGAMPALRSLSIGAGSAEPSLVARAEPGGFPETLEELRLLEESGRILVWPELALPRLRSLTVLGRLRVDPGMLPGLEHLAVVPDRALRDLPQLLRLPLRGLELLRLPVGGEIFEALAGRPLERLALVSGTKLASLDGIAALPGLASLRLKNLSGLADVSALRALAELTRLDIQYCRRITDVTAIAALPKLERLTLVGCGSVGIDAIRETIDALPRCTIGATS
ncbi:hypothetical protein MUN77_09595 [Leucobacter allii]|uniref:hypothetical protein n=1 Tax=Leucobacter allii TaxID=2932247 RepID=UPI001FD4A916|nr:hypothetical protein [Leucobacter allii]UOR00423.1 hypothetical protein MUN77_09595 [Leucobacter allii]